MNEVEARRQRMGVALALIASVGLGLAVAVARYAYEGGSNGLTVATSRASLMAVGIAIFCLATGRPLRLPRRDLLNCLGLGMLTAMMFYGNIGAVQFISVGLTALLFFTFPPLIALINIVVLRQKVAPVRLAAVAIAFAGLATMLGVSLEIADPRGVALALGAAVAAGWHAVWMQQRTRHIDSFVVTFHLAWVAAATLWVLSLSLGALQWPELAIGWFGLMGVAMLQSMSVPCYFFALPLIGALKAGVITNLQPVVSIVAAFLLFGELLTPVQLAGGALVLAGVWLMQWDGRPKR